MAEPTLHLPKGSWRHEYLIFLWRGLINLFSNDLIFSLRGIYMSNFALRFCTLNIDPKRVRMRLPKQGQSAKSTSKIALVNDVLKVQLVTEKQSIISSAAKVQRNWVSRFIWRLDSWMEQSTLKNVNNCLNTHIYSYLETSGGKSYNLYLKAVHFFQCQY